MPDLSAEQEIFKACSDATRLRILTLLSTGELCVCELVDVLQMQQAKVSRHLAILRAAGLVRDRRVATWIHYSLNRPPVPGQGLDQLPGQVRPAVLSPLWRHVCAWLDGEARQASADDLERLRERSQDPAQCPPGRAQRQEEVTA